MIEAVVGGLLSVLVNTIQIQNADFFYWRAENEKNKACHWEYVGKTPANPNEPSLAFFDNVWWKHICEDKPDD